MNVTLHSKRDYAFMIKDPEMGRLEDYSGGPPINPLVSSQEMWCDDGKRLEWYSTFLSWKKGP